MANVIGRPIEEFVEEQIKDRQKISGAGYDSGIAKTPSVINYLNNRNAWIKLASGVSFLTSFGMPIFLIIFGYRFLKMFIQIFHKRCSTSPNNV